MLKSISTLLLLITVLLCADPITIGTEKTTDHKLPVFCEQAYSYSQSIYLKNEIGGPVTISKIAYQYTGEAWTQDLKIYIGNTTKDEFIYTYPNRDWVPLKDMTKVFDGSVTVSAGWVEIILSKPFVYDGVANLVVAVDENSPYYSEEGDDFYGSTVATRRSMLRVGGEDVDPTDPQMSGLTYRAIANIQLFPQSAKPELMVSPTSIDFPSTPTDAPFRAGKISLTNFGAGILTINSREDISLSGLAANSFTLFDSLTYPLQLASGQSANIYAKFTPGSAGSKNATVDITTQGDRAEHLAVVTLNGSAYNPYTTSSAGGVGFAEDFEDYLATNGAYYKDWYVEWGSSSIAAHSGTTSIYVPAGYTLGAVTPRLEVAAGDSISFYLQRNAEVSATSIKVAFTENANPLTNSYTTLYTANEQNVPTTFTENTSYHKLSLAACAGKKVYLAFIGTSTGGSTRMDDITFKGTGTAIEPVEQVKSAVLLNNYPNPFNNTSVIRYNLPVAGQVKITVYNVAGALVKELFAGTQLAGQHSLTFEAGDLQSGLYFCRLETAGKSQISRMVLLK